MPPADHRRKGPPRVPGSGRVRHPWDVHTAHREWRSTKMAGYSGFGTRFERGDGGTPETFDLIGEATDMSGPEQERDTIEDTSHQSPEGFRECVGGVSAGGEVSSGLPYAPALHNVLQDQFADPLPRDYRFLRPDRAGGIRNDRAV